MRDQKKDRLVLPEQVNCSRDWINIFHGSVGASAKTIRCFSSCPHRRIHLPVLNCAPGTIGGDSICV